MRNKKRRYAHCGSPEWRMTGSGPQIIVSTHLYQTTLRLTTSCCHGRWTRAKHARQARRYRTYCVPSIKPTSLVATTSCNWLPRPCDNRQSTVFGRLFTCLSCWPSIGAPWTILGEQIVVLGPYNGSLGALHKLVGVHCPLWLPISPPCGLAIRRWTCIRKVLGSTPVVFFFSYACHEPQLVSHETASSFAECSRDKPPFSFVRGQDSTMWDIVWVSPQGHRSVSVSRHFRLQAPQCPCFVWKRFSRDHCCRGRSKPGCRIVGSHIRWELTTWADFQLCLHRLLMSTVCKSSHSGFLDVVTLLHSNVWQVATPHCLGLES